MASEQRGSALTTFAILFGVVAVSNLLKPLQLGGAHTGFVFFGQRTSGTTNAILGPLFGIYLLVYAVGIWRLRRFAHRNQHPGDHPADERIWACLDALGA